MKQKSFSTLAQSYGIDLLKGNPKDASIRLMQMTGIRHFRVGTNKIFMRRDDLDLLENSQQRCIVVPQKNNFLQPQTFDSNNDVII